MRYLHRTHRISFPWLHESFERDDLSLVYELTTRMCADIYTKAFTDVNKWKAACWFINIVDPYQLKDFLKDNDDMTKKDAKSAEADVAGNNKGKGTNGTTQKTKGTQNAVPSPLTSGGVPHRTSDHPRGVSSNSEKAPITSRTSLTSERCGPRGGVHLRSARTHAKTF